MIEFACLLVEYIHNKKRKLSIIMHREKDMERQIVVHVAQYAF